MTIPDFWSLPNGRELDATPLEDVSPKRVVACVNFWNDLSALEKTVPTWLPYVDHVIAVDGAYNTSDDGLSTDGSREFFERLSVRHSIQLVNAAGLSQCEKRTRYLRLGKPHDMLFIVDADELVERAAILRALPRFDVGWIRVRSTLYAREYGQPRLIRWVPDLEYRGRHHWIYQGDRLLCTHQYSGTGYEQRPVSLLIRNNRELGRGKTRMHAKRAHHVIQVEDERAKCAIPESQSSDAQIGGREALQILTYAYRDDGLAPSRLHTAINRTTPHSSVFFKRRPGPFGVPDQYNTQGDAPKFTRALSMASVIHCHGVMSLAKSTARSTPIVFHHHGTLYRTNAAEYNAQAKDRNALVLLSNMELFSWTDGLTAHFLPNTVPVARYRALHEQVCVPFTGSNPFLVAHSPSQMHRKGTDVFLAACERLKQKNVPIQPIVIHDQTHRNALMMKAQCHASFDSFWLGMQCSGIEAGAMGMAVIGGDPTVYQRYIDELGYCPYTFANDGEALEQTLYELVNDAWFRAEEANRVHKHIVQWHDEAAVALRYLNLLDDHFHWRSSPLRPARTFLTNRRAMR